MSLSSILDRFAGQPPLRRRKKRLRPARFFVEALEHRALLTTYTVNSTSPGLGGAGVMTLVGAIGLANQHPNDTSGPDVINFDIAGSGVQTISVLALPAITDPVIIDGTTQSDYAPGQPQIDIDGSLAGNVDGLVFHVGGNTVEGLIINNFAGAGIVLDGTSDPSHGNNIVANFIGTDSSGKTAEGNGSGILLDHSAHNFIGGLDVEEGGLVEGNLISGNFASGIEFLDQDCTDNHVEGNFIGTDVDGLQPLQNHLDGVFLGAPEFGDIQTDGFASGNIIGGTDPGARNVISGNGHNGVYILGGSENDVAGNDIGVGEDGVTAVPNGENGVRIEDASQNLVGGVQNGPGSVSYLANVLSANKQDGIEVLVSSQSENLIAMPVSDQNATGNGVQSNFIGTDSSGQHPLPNGANGVEIVDANLNTIGGTKDGAGNLISANAMNGILLRASNESVVSNAIQGNVIGGAFPLANGLNGIVLSNESSDPSVTMNRNLIGGADADDGAADGTVKARNIISGNTVSGILLVGPRIDTNFIEGNFIGTDSSGQHKVANGTDGILLQALAGQTDGPTNTRIGGDQLGTTNVISGNGADGVLLDSGSSLTSIIGNVIGAGSDRQTPLSNLGNGVEIVDSSSNTIASNTIAANSKNGILIRASSQSVFGNQIQGNDIGSTGQEALPNIELDNHTNGIELENQSSDPSIILSGTSIGGDDVGTRNYISGNDLNGVLLFGPRVDNSIIQGNFIGTRLQGDEAILNGVSGISLQSMPGQTVGPSGTLIGGAEAGAGNTISGNGDDGVLLDLGSSHTTVVGNVIGTSSDGQAALPNAGDGIEIVDSSSNRIGILTNGGGNLISSNAKNGILIRASGQSVTGNQIQGNFIGTNADGTTASPNGLNGIVLANESSDPSVFVSGNTIGGADADDGVIDGRVEARNIISGNTLGGVFLIGQRVDANVVQGNFIGTDLAGDQPIPNGNGGILLQSMPGQTVGPSGTLIGGTEAGAANTISGNGADGVLLDLGSSDTSVAGNFIGTSSDGQGALPNAGNGVEIVDASSNTIGGLADGTGNLISSNAKNGILIRASSQSVTGNQIQGNLIGTDGTTASPNGLNGIVLANESSDPTVFLSGTLIGGADADDGAIDGSVKARNIISGNLLSGVFLVGPRVQANIIRGNFIGTNAAGTQAIPNGNYGVLLQAMAGQTVGPSGTQIGGTQAGAGNTISGNGADGVLIDSGSSLTKVFGNQIGTSADGQNPLPNGGDGVHISNASLNLIGESTKAAANLISANAGSGVHIEGNQASGNEVVGNNIGTDRTGSFDEKLGNALAGVSIVNAGANTIGGDVDSIGLAPGNTIRGNATGVVISGANTQIVQGNLITDSKSYGVDLLGNASNNQIGGLNSVDANRITANGKAGVFVESGVGNAILHNQILANGGLGIDLAPEGPNANQPRETVNAGPNGLQNVPLLTFATTGSQRIAGSLESAANSTFRIEFFLNDASGSADPDEGASFLAVSYVQTNASGIASFDAQLPNTAKAGQFVTATATDSQGNTSEFSQPVPIMADADDDGIPDDLENAGPNLGDGNDDGVPDGQQAQVASFPNTGNGDYVTLVAPEGTTLANVTPLDNPSPDDAPQNVDFDLGFFDFTVSGVTPGKSVSIELVLPEGSAPHDYYRYGPTPDDPQPHWYDWLYNGQTGAEIDGNHVTLHFIDGGYGDDDLLANGTIVDAGGPGFAGSFTVTNTADSGPGSLRQAILNADANLGSTITFDLPGSGPQTIQPLSPLPAITASVTIDGTTQPGFAGTPLVELDGSLAGPGADGLTVASGSATIQGLVIDRFTGDGIHVLTAGSALIEGNDLGTNANGASGRGNGRFGVEVENHSQINGNVISGNLAGGISMHGAKATNSSITSNFIGTQADGISPLGNAGPGVVIDGGSSGNSIGSQSSSNGNTIAYNTGSGVEILQGTNNLIKANSIFANKGLGIDLGGDGVTPNDAGDGDSGPNDLQNYPVLAGASSYGGRTFISGTLNSSADSSFALDFYGSDSADPSGFGQGQSYLGSIFVTTDDNGRASFDVNLAASAAQGSYITATASLAGIETSEFSATLQVSPSAPLVLLVNTGDDANDSVPDPAHFSLREAILAANAHPGQDIIDFDLPNLDRIVTPLSPLPNITDPVIIDGTSQPGYRGLPLIEIDGSKAGAGVDGLTITGGGSVVRGMVIHSFQNGITLEGLGGNVIEGDFIGTDVTGTNALPDKRADVYVNDSPDNLIGGTTPAARNVILLVDLSGFNATTNNVDPNAGGNRVEGNYIGTDLTGTAFLAGGLLGSGIRVESANANTIGGLEAGAGNVIDGSVALLDASNNVVQGNLIGTDVTGTVVLSRGATPAETVLGGVQVAAGNSSVVASNNLIGGTTPAARNIIAGGVSIAANSNQVRGNYIGTDITGTIALGKSIPNSLADGVEISGTGNTIGGTQSGAGNLISGNPGAGVYFDPPANNNLVLGNRIGTDVTGTKALGNGRAGVISTGYNNTIGGPTPGAGNLISGNDLGGLTLGGVRGDTVEGNFIGTDYTGTVALGNGKFTIENDGIDVAENNAIIGGSRPGAGNVISGNPGSGVVVRVGGYFPGGVLIQGNHIGTDVTGTLPLGNGGDGVDISGSPNDVIGGPLPGAGNVIAANGGEGIRVLDPQGYVDQGNSSTGTLIQGNKIGTDVTGTRHLGNAEEGVSIVTSNFIASDETVGGIGPGSGNVVAFNGGPGISVPFGIGNSVEGNDIFANGGLGIITDINGALSTYAEQRGIDAAHSAPVLSSAIVDPQGTLVTGALTGVPFTRYDVDFFASDAVDPSGFGDGQTYLESISVLVDDGGSTQFQIPLDPMVPIGEWITATATPDNGAGNTSMFSQPVPVIAADPETVQFSAPAYLVTETGGAAVVMVTRTGSTDGTVTVNYATSDGTASAGTNYTAEAGTLTFNEGESSKTLTIPVKDDGLADGDKGFQIALSDASGATLGPMNQANVTIADSDTAGQIGFASATFTVDRALNSASLQVTRTGGSQGSVTVDYRVTGGTAVGVVLLPKLGASLDADYLDNFGSVTFKDGQTTAEITFTYVQDLINNSFSTPDYRGPRTIEVTLGNPTGGAALAALTTSVLTIEDDEDLAGAFGVSAAFSAANVKENGGKAQVQVFRAGQLSTTESVSYTTVDGTAKAGKNYTATSGTLTFQPGQTAIYFYVPIIDDHVVDDPGDFQVVLSNPTGGAFVFAGLDECDVTILDSDAPASPGHFVVANQSFFENSGSAQITVGRLDGASGVAQVSYATSDGTATAGADYTATSGTLTFNNGETSKTFTVPILPDNLVEGDETFFVTLSNPTGGTSVGPLTEGSSQFANPATETIYETSGQVQINAAAYRVAENNAGLTVAITLDSLPDPDGRPAGNVTVDYATRDGTATAGSDYTAVSGTLTFNQSVATVTIPIINDVLVENDETFFLTLSNPTGGISIGDRGTTTITILDEDSQGPPPAQGSTTTLMSDQASGSTYGQTVTFTAVVGAASGIPTGSVDFLDTTTGQDLGLSQLGVVNGIDEASVSVSSLDARSHTIVASYTSDTDNFVDSHDSLTQLVAPAMLTVTADNKTKVSGTANPSLTDAITGFVNGDTSSVVSGTSLLSTTATATSPVGGYPIVVGPGTLTAANYTFAFVNGMLTVTTGGNTPVLTLIHDTPASATEGSSTTLTSTSLQTTDSDTSVSASTIVYVITAAPTLGTLSDNGVPVVRGGSFSQQDIDDGSVTYQSTEEGADSFAFSVASGVASPITGTLAITASDPAVVATGGFTYSATEGTLGAVQAVATFTDPGGVEAQADYAATIDWGDGTSATNGALSVDPNTHVFTVAGQHNYAAEGSFAIKVTLAHESAPAVTMASTAGIMSATSTGEGGIAATGLAVNGYEFSALTGVSVAIFTDTDVSLTASDFSAVIGWGDGTTSTGTISNNAGGTPIPQFTVTGTHEYLDEGRFTIQVRISNVEIVPPVPSQTATVSAAGTIHEQLLENGSVGTPDQNWIQEMYRDLFHRQAELQGLDYWVGLLNGGEGREQVAFQIVKIASFEEFQRDTVAALYEQYLGRAPDPAGLDYWAAYLYDGGTIEGLSQALVSSPEYFHTRGGGTVQGFLNAAFRDALGRQIDSAALTYFAGLMSDGVPPAQVATTIFTSDEYHRLRVNSLLEQFLDRTADPGALTYFAGELDNGDRDEIVITQLISSDEYFEKAQT